ncbi:very-short-patch-repair endonuclease [Aquimarina intermedia]|uniref:Very-short-patch-repair endonuclease n=2 Tax=Aquimarina intermedia TaxID=350814 RepID=A0A5S5C9X7_9FLAO|nr:very-short-patch-repair endonuclease [Aquimarina intermedia]
MTSCEMLLWKRIRKGQLHVLFFRQFPILDYVVDFYAKEIGLAIEVDGTSHDHMLEDSHRQQRIEKLGVQFIRFTNKEILENLDGVVDELTDMINNYS